MVTQLVFTLLPGLVIAVITSWLTVRLSLRRFYSERWWERQVEAYSKIIEALYDEKHWGNEWLSAKKEGRKVDDERAEHLRLKSLEARDHVARATAIGAFIISEEAAHQLEELDFELKRIWEDRFEGVDSFVERQNEAIDQCLKFMRESAKRNLKVS